MWRSREMADDFLMAENEALTGAETPESACAVERWWR